MQHPNLLVWLCLLVGFGCEPSPRISISSVTVHSPLAGRVTIQEQSEFVSPTQSAIFDQVAGGQYDMTFIADSVRFTLQGLKDDTIHLSGFFEPIELRPSQLIPVSFRLDPNEDAQFVVIADERVWRPEVGSEGDSLTVELPARSEAVAIALWTGQGQLRWRVEPLDMPETLQGRVISLTPEVEPRATLITHVNGLPSGWLRTELVYEGIRTGLMVGDGFVSPRQAVGIKTLGAMHPTLSYRISVQSRSAQLDTPLAEMAMSIDLARTSLGIEWPEAPEVTPLLVRPSQALPVAVESSLFQVSNTVDRTHYLDVHLQTLGDCQDFDWRVISPDTEAFKVPEIYAQQIADAPLIRASVARISLSSGRLADVYSGTYASQREPRFWAERFVRRTGGYWRQDSGCTGASLEGRYAVYRADQTDCPIAGVTDLYVIGRCGELIRLESGSIAQTEHCGRFEDNQFISLAAQERSVVEGPEGRLRVGSELTGFVLVPIAAPDVTAGADLVGDWWTVEITEQDFVNDESGGEIAQNDPVLVSVGGREGGPWLTIEARGHAKSVARLARFELTLRNGADGVYFEVDSPGCYEQPRHLRRLPDEADKLVLEEILPYETPGEFRKRIYTYRR